MQTRLHDSVCEKRTASTLATHDLDKIVTDVTPKDELENLDGSNEAQKLQNELVYDAKPPNELVLLPLGNAKECTGAKLFQNLRDIAEQNRRDKKRNVYSGVHR